MKHLYVLALSVAVWTASLMVVSAARKRVRLRDIQMLVFNKGIYSEARRSSAVPQLECVGGEASHEYQPETIACRNAGWDGNDVVWKCEAELPPEYKLGRTTVSCEGYDYPDDEYVLAGSCGLEYTIVYTSGRRRSRFPTAHRFGASGMYNESWVSTMIQWGVTIAICYFIYLSCCSGRSGRRGSGGGGGYNAPGDPPPYSASHQYHEPGPSCSTYPSAPSYSSSPSSGPGFFSGMGLGSALGYMFGRSRDRTSTYGGGYSNVGGSSFGFQPSGYGGGGGGGMASTSSASSTRTSSSYATTRRR